MKSEHRHELQANELNKYTEQSLGFFKTYGNQIMIVVCLVSIVASGIIYWQRVTNTRLEQAWSDLAFASQPAEYQFILSDAALSKTPAAPWARLQESDGRMQEGIRLMFTERERGLNEIKLARTGYEDLLAQKSVDPLIRERALFGYARSLETLSDGKLEKAIEAYENLLKEFPDSLYKPTVEQQVKDLRRGNASNFYAWFSQQKPTTAVPGRLPSDKGKSGKGFTKSDFDLKDGPTIVDPDNPDLPILDPTGTDDGKIGKKSDPSEKGTGKAADPARIAVPKTSGPKLEAPTKDDALKAPALPDSDSTDPAPKTATPQLEKKDAEKKDAEKKVEAKSATPPTAPAKTAEPAKKTDDKKGP